MSQVTTTTPPVTVVCTGALTTTTTVTMVPTLLGLAETFSQNYVALLPPLKLMDTVGMLFALPLCHNNNLSQRCLLRLMAIMPWVLLR